MSLFLSGLAALVFLVALVVGAFQATTPARAVAFAVYCTAVALVLPVAAWVLWTFRGVGLLVLWVGLAGLLCYLRRDALLPYLRHLAGSRG